jgi:hypothetical protein|tara:strand:- start:302 stop:427 length:126 start_codon:yes stop_codon:yes gene_type:complete
MAEQPRIRIFELQDGTRVGKQLLNAEVAVFLAANAGSTLIR